MPEFPRVLKLASLASDSPDDRPWFQKIKNLPVTPRGPLRKFFFRVCVRHFGTIFNLFRIFRAENVMTRGVRS